MLANGSMWAHCVRSPNTYHIHKHRGKEGGSLTLAHVVGGVNHFVNILDKHIYHYSMLKRRENHDIKVLFN